VLKKIILDNYGEIFHEFKPPSRLKAVDGVNENFESY
jgi:hypothetical protein